MKIFCERVFFWINTRSLLSASQTTLPFRCPCSNLTFTCIYLEREGQGGRCGRGATIKPPTSYQSVRKDTKDERAGGALSWARILVRERRRKHRPVGSGAVCGATSSACVWVSAVASVTKGHGHGDARRQTPDAKRQTLLRPFLIIVSLGRTASREKERSTTNYSIRL